MYEIYLQKIRPNKKNSPVELKKQEQIRGMGNPDVIQAEHKAEPLPP